jgi:hypothetical protein
LPGSTVPSNLRANDNHDTITFGVIVQPSKWRRAEQIIRSGVQLVEGQLQAQAELPARYEANMTPNAGALAAALSDGRNFGNGAGRLTIDMEH